MKQNEIIIGEKYELCRMQYKGMPELNRTIVTIIGKKRGNKKRGPHIVPNPGRSPHQYKTDIGIKVSATNLKERRPE